MSFCLSPFTLPGGAPAAKKGGRSLHQHPSRVARRCAGRGGDTRGAASLRFVAEEAGSPRQPLSDTDFQVKTPPQQRRGAPSEREALWL